jgi:hypothetical protein
MAILVTMVLITPYYKITGKCFSGSSSAKERITNMADKGAPESRYQFDRDPSGTSICRTHRQPLIRNSVTSAPGSNPPGLGHFSAWLFVPSRRKTSSMRAFRDEWPSYAASVAAKPLE